MTTTKKRYDLKSLDLLTQVKLFIVVLRTLEEPAIKKIISFDEFLYNKEYQNIIISSIVSSGIDTLYQAMPDNNTNDYTTDQKNILFLKLFIC